MRDGLSETARGLFFSSVEKKKIEVLRCVSVVSIHILMNRPTDRYPTCAHLLAECLCPKPGDDESAAEYTTQGTTGL